MVTNTNKMLQILIDGQASIRLDIKKLDLKIDEVEQRLTKRIDSIGLAEARLEDDTPTRDEFDKLEQKVNTHLSSPHNS